MCVLVHVHLSIQQTFPWDLCPVQGLLAQLGPRVPEQRLTS